MSQYIDESIAFYEEIFEISIMDQLEIKYKILDDIDFFNECKKETGSDELSDFLVISIPKDEEDMKTLLLINDYVDKYQDNYGLEILYSQLGTIVINQHKKLEEFKRKCKAPIIKKAIYGIEYWKEFFSIYCTQYALKEKNKDSDDEENPYNTEQSLKIGLNFLNKAITSPSKSIDERLSLMTYSFAKISVTEEDETKEIYDLKPFIKNESLKKYIQDLYCILSSKNLDELTILHFMKINYLINKIKNVFNEEERTGNE